MLLNFTYRYKSYNAPPTLSIEKASDNLSLFFVLVGGYIEKAFLFGVFRPLFPPRPLISKRANKQRGIIQQNTITGANGTNYTHNSIEVETCRNMGLHNSRCVPLQDAGVVYCPVRLRIWNINLTTCSLRGACRKGKVVTN